jgi:hypothetical protein
VQVFRGALSKGERQEKMPGRHRNPRTPGTAQSSGLELRRESQA